MAEQTYGDWIRSNPALPTEEFKHMAQQSAVEWLLKFIEPSLTPEQKQFFSIVISQSKKMNEQQTVDAYKHGQNNGYNYRSNGTNYITGEEYYEQTFKK